MVHTKEINKKKYLIQFPISVNLEKVRKLVEGPCPTVLPKANTRSWCESSKIHITFDRTIGNRSVLLPTINAENGSIWKPFHCSKYLENSMHSSWWKGKIYRQLFFVTTANASPNLLSRDGCYTLGVLKPCYSVETSKSSSAQPTTDLEQHQMHGESFLHWSDEGTGEEELSNSTQQSLYKDQLQGISLKKQGVLRVYSVVTTGIGKSPRHSKQVPAATKWRNRTTCT